MFTLLVALLLLFLLCMFLMDTLQVLLRAVSTMLDAPVLGAHLGSVFMLANRAATALALLTIGYFVDSYVARGTLQWTYAAAASLIAIFHIPLLARKPLIAVTVKASTLLYRKSFQPELIARSLAAGGDRAVADVSTPIAVIATVGLLGLLGPSLLAATYPDYRATLMQTGFIVNSAASIINVMYVERQIAMTLDEGDERKISSLLHSYTVSRAVGYLLAAVAFLAIGLVLP